MPCISYTPKDTLVDEIVTVVVGGLKPGEKVTLRSSCYNDRNDLFEAFAFYKSNAEGVVSLSKDRALYGGSYEGVEPMGLFWSLKASTLNKKNFARMSKKNVERPLGVKIEVFHGWEDLERLRKNAPFADTIINRWYKSKGVIRVPVKEGKIRGTLFIPRGSGPFPAVIDMFGGAGGLFEFRASMFASRGFLSLALALFAYDDLSYERTPSELNYFEDAVQFLQNHPKSRKEGIGVVGTSIGAEVALAMATYVPGVTCCVSINGGIFNQLEPLFFRGYHITPMVCDISNMIFTDSNIMHAHNLVEIPMKAKDVNRHLIEFHKSPAAFLFLRSELDGCYHMDTLEKVSNELLKRYFGGVGKYKSIFYPGAGHLLELPNNPFSKFCYISLISGVYQHYGGRVKDHARAQEHSWGEILKFLKQNIIPKCKAKY